MTDTPAPRPRPRLHALDGLRGVCALAIMYFHFHYWNGINYFQVGAFGVYLFFVLSGFSLWYVYAHRTPSIDMFKSFFIARFARIVPLYVLAVLLATAARLYGEGVGSILNMAFLNRLLLNLSFLFGLEAPGHTSMVPGGWSLGVEWVFYALFPLALLFLRRLRAMLVLLAVGLLINQTTSLSLFAQGTYEQEWAFYAHFPTFLVYFIGGVTMAEVYNRLQHAGYRPAPVHGLWLFRLLPFLLLMLIFFYPSATKEEYLTGWHVALLVVAAMVAVLCASLVTGVTRLETRLCAFLGDISYSTYLLHFFVYNAMTVLVKSACPACGIDLLMLLSACVTVPLAWLSYRFFESPARQRITRLCGAYRLAPPH